MSSRKASPIDDYVHSKNSHQASKIGSGSRSSLASKQQKNPSGPSSSPSHKPREQTFSIHTADSIAARASSLRVSKPSNTMASSDFVSDITQTFTADASDLLSTQVDLLELSAWTYSRQSSQYCHNFSNQSYDSTQTTTCPYHASTMDSHQNAAGLGSDTVPLERWFQEDAGDGGAVALQLGHQLRVDCTCIVMQGAVDMDAVNGLQDGVTSPK